MIKISFTINDDQTHNEHAQVKIFPSRPSTSRKVFDSIRLKNKLSIKQCVADHLNAFQLLNLLS